MNFSFGIAISCFTEISLILSSVWNTFHSTVILQIGKTQIPVSWSGLWGCWRILCFYKTDIGTRLEEVRLKWLDTLHIVCRITNSFHFHTDNLPISLQLTAVQLFRVFYWLKDSQDLDSFPIRFQSLESKLDQSQKRSQTFLYFTWTKLQDHK